MNHLPGSLILSLLLLNFCSFAAEDRDAKVRNDRSDVLAAGKWTYNDLAKGIDEAKASGKPLLVVVRCIPCLACQGFDARVLQFDPLVQELMQKFVCVRIVQANGLDLSLFGHDYDLSFAAYFLNPDKTIYGRFGSRSEHKNAEHEISLEGFRKAMLAALDLHKNFDRNRASLQGKRGGVPQFTVPEEFPSLKTKYKATLNYEGKVAGTCIHCHQVREAERLVFRSAGQPIPEQVLYPWPMPDVTGFSLDPTEKAKVKNVAARSAADKSGLRAGDEIVLFEGQPIISLADVQWVLHNAASPATLKVEVDRDGKRVPLMLELEKDWRRKSDISWRATSWDLRRMFTGGLVLKDSSADERKDLHLADSDLALRVDYVGQYGEHGVGKKAGFQKNDVWVSVDGKAGHMTESDLFGYLAGNRMPGSRIPVTVVRTGNKVELELKMQ
jgi:hypothetical protein